MSGLWKSFFILIGLIAVTIFTAVFSIWLWATLVLMALPLAN